MKRLLFFLVGVLVLDASLPTARAASGYDDTHRFIYYAVMEGCYEDGLANSDIDQILLKGDKNTHLHFVYSCPLCMPTIHALQAYRSRPERFYGMKSDTSTFGKGLAPELGAKLHGTNATERLETINALVQRWIQRRMTQLRLTDAERTTLQGELEARRKKGMEALQNFRKSAPAFSSAPVEQGQCAVCNGAVGLEYLPPKK